MKEMKQNYVFYLWNAFFSKERHQGYSWFNNFNIKLALINHL